MTRAIRRAQLLLIASTFTFTTAVLAQDLPDVAQGLQPYASYHGGELDNVSLVNGGLTVRIPLATQAVETNCAPQPGITATSGAFWKAPLRARSRAFFDLVSTD